MKDKHGNTIDEICWCQKCPCEECISWCNCINCDDETCPCYQYKNVRLSQATNEESRQLTAPQAPTKDLNSGNE